MEAAQAQHERFIPSVVRCHKVRVQEVETHETKDDDEVRDEAPPWPIPIACQQIEEQREQVASYFSLSSENHPLKQLCAIGKVGCLLT